MDAVERSPSSPLVTVALGYFTATLDVTVSHVGTSPRPRNGSCEQGRVSIFRSAVPWPQFLTDHYRTERH